LDQVLGVLEADAESEQVLAGLRVLGDQAVGQRGRVLDESVHTAQ
jgi:hypothetical protein